jgi:hypothetical protein
MAGSVRCRLIRRGKRAVRDHLTHPTRPRCHTRTRLPRQVRPGDPAEPDNRGDGQQHVGDLIFGRARRQRPGGAPFQADLRRPDRRQCPYPHQCLGLGIEGPVRRRAEPQPGLIAGAFSSTIASLRKISWYLTARPIRSALSAGRSLHPARRPSLPLSWGRKGGFGITLIWVLNDQPVPAATPALAELAAEQADRRRSSHRVVPGRDTQLAVDRLDLGLDRVAGEEQPLCDLVGGEVGLQIGKQA